MSHCVDLPKGPSILSVCNPPSIVRILLEFYCTQSLREAFMESISREHFARYCLLERP